ncbi:hypothetical protein G9A89_013770 [Geosiphon pyriformis]|nr:hypothetical protein G9A89_013770 [Geosiphon pyriformis]
MTTIKAKSKKAAPDICPEISNKISTRKAFSVVEATRQNVLEVFSLPSNSDKLPLVATEATSSSLAGFSPVKVPSKRHTWISPSVASTPTKSPKVFNNRPVNKLVFPFIDSTSGASGTTSSKKMVKKTKSSEKWGQLLASVIVTPNLFVHHPTHYPRWAKINYWLFLETKQSSPVGSPKLIHQRFAGWVASTLVPDATFKIKLAHIKTVFQFVHGFLGAKSVSKDNLTSSVCLTTLKIAKSLVVSESGSSPAAVALHNVPLGVSAADVKLALNVFGSVTYVVLKPAGIWQYVVVYFEKLDSAVSALKHWSVLMGKDSAKLVNLPPGCTIFEISDMISQIGGQTCFILCSPNSGCHSRFALVTFASQGNLDSAVVKTGTLRKCCIWWETPGCRHCFRYQEMGHLAVNCKISPPPTPKVPKVFKSCFVGGVFYVKTSAFLDSSEFPSLVASTFLSMVVESDLVKLSILIESIIKPIGSLVKLFEQFVNGDLVSSSKLGLKVNEVMVHMGFFSKIVGKLGKKVVSLKKECCMEDIDMSGNLEHPVGLDDEVFFNLLFFWEHESIDVKADALKTAE